MTRSEPPTPEASATSTVSAIPARLTIAYRVPTTTGSGTMRRHWAGSRPLTLYETGQIGTRIADLIRSTMWICGDYWRVMKQRQICFMSEGL